MAEKEIKIEVVYDNKRIIAELPREVSVDELFSIILTLIDDVAGSREILHESIENYYETFIKIEND